MKNEEKIVKKIQRDFIKSCEENLKLSKEIHKLKKLVADSPPDSQNVLMEIHEEEMQILVETYIKNAQTVGMCMAILNLDAGENFSLN